MQTSPLVMQLTKWEEEQTSGRSALRLRKRM